MLCSEHVSNATQALTPATCSCRDMMSLCVLGSITEKEAEFIEGGRCQYL